MADEVVETSEAPEVSEPNLTQVLEQLTTLQTGQADLVTQLTPAPEAAPAPAPTPAPVPPTPQGRVTRAQYEELAQYAADQRQIAERVQLAAEYKLSPEDLEGDFESPSDMRRHAEVLSLRNQLVALETKLAVSPEEALPTVPVVDAGGPTSMEDPGVAELRRKYDEARAMGRTAQGRRGLLAAIYNDPTKRQLIRRD